MEQFHHFLDQSRLYVDYVEGLYNVLDRIQEKYSDLMMMCSGGGGRSDYEGLRYFTEFWPSDNTDPIERLCPCHHVEPLHAGEIPHQRGHDGQARLRHQA